MNLFPYRACRLNNKKYDWDECQIDNSSSKCSECWKCVYDVAVGWGEKNFIEGAGQSGDPNERVGEKVLNKKLTTLM